VTPSPITEAPAPAVSGTAQRALPPRYLSGEHVMAHAPETMMAVAGSCTTLVEVWENAMGAFILGYRVRGMSCRLVVVWVRDSSLVV
jgi:hypothetical protein